MTMGRWVLAAALVGLAGCSQQQPEVTTNNTVEEAPAPKPKPKPIEAPPAENMSENVAVPAEKPIAADQQMMDDASATGMTSHVSREEAPANTQ